MMIFLKLRELKKKIKKKEECKYINCSKFPGHTVCTKPGSEGVKDLVFTRRPGESYCRQLRFLLSFV